MKKTRLIWLIILSACLFAVMVEPVRAQTDDGVNYHAYSYSYWGQPVASPAGFTVEETKNGEELGVGKLFEPKDLYISPQRELYIVDSGNDRVMVFDLNWKQLRTIDKLIAEDGSENVLKSPSGVFVDRDGAVLIADTGNKRVVRCDENGHILAVYQKPDADIQFTGIDFLPYRVLSDDTGCVYVLCQGIYQGALVYEADGAFIGYYGTNYVEAGVVSALKLFWKNLASEERRSKMERFVPEEFTSFDIDEKGFVYTVTEITKTSKNQIKKINPLGVNVLDDNTRIQSNYWGRYGDLELRWYGGKVLQPRFVDICYDGEGFINALDRERGRVFQYDTEGNLIMLGGGTAGQSGTFKKATAIECADDRLYLLDEQKANITVFRFTEYGKEIRQATQLYTAGRFSESRVLWKSVLEKNANCELAYAGIGKAFYEEGKYGEAMHFCKLGYDRKGYAKAFAEYRAELVGRYLPWVATAAVALTLAVLIRSWVRRARKTLKRFRG